MTLSYDEARAQQRSACWTETPERRQRLQQAVATLNQEICRE